MGAPMSYKKSDDMEYIKAVKSTRHREDIIRVVEPIPVTEFGIIGEKQKFMVRFIVGDRPDRRHGVMGQPAPFDPYSKSLFYDMFRRW